MEALCLAHIEALQTLHSAGVEEVLRRSPAVASLSARSLAHAVECGPAALAAVQSFQEVFVSYLRCLPMVRCQTSTVDGPVTRTYVLPAASTAC